jgi:hypothetical protein
VDKILEVEDPVDKRSDVIKEVTVEKIGHSPPPFTLLPLPLSLVSLSICIYICMYVCIYNIDRLYRDILTLVNWQCLLRTSK